VGLAEKEPSYPENYDTFLDPSKMSKGVFKSMVLDVILLAFVVQNCLNFGVPLL
jgi:hypothetical protein